MDNHYWSKACAAFGSRPISEQMTASTGGTTVALISFLIATLFSGFSFVRWFMNPDKSQMWDKLGSFCLIVFISSLVGAVSIVMAIKMFDFHYQSRTPGMSPYDVSMLTSTSFRFRAAWITLFQVQVFFGVVSKMMLLDRLSSSAAQRVRTVSDSHDSSQNGLINGINKNFIAKAGLSLPSTYKISTIATVLSSFIAVVADIVASAYVVRAADLHDQAANAIGPAGNSNDLSKALVSSANGMMDNARTAIAARSVNNAFTLTVMTLAFTIILSCSVAIFRAVENFGAKALQMVSSNLQSKDSSTHKIVSDTVDAAAEQRRHLTLASSIVLLTFPPCVGYYLLFAYANFNQVQSDCGKVCDPCQSTQFLIRKWMDATPEFWTLVCSVSSPLTMALCIWIVNRAHARASSISAAMHKAGFVQ